MPFANRSKIKILNKMPPSSSKIPLCDTTLTCDLSWPNIKYLPTTRQIQYLQQRKSCILLVTIHQIWHVHCANRLRSICLSNILQQQYINTKIDDKQSNLPASRSNTPTHRSEHIFCHLAECFICQRSINSPASEAILIITWKIMHSVYCLLLGIRPLQLTDHISTASASSRTQVQ